MASTGSNFSAPSPEPVAAGATEVVIGIVGFNNADTIGDVVRSVSGALERYLGSHGSCIVLADGGSTDHTIEKAREANGSRELIEVDYSSADAGRLPYHGVPGRADAVRALLLAVQERGARACAVVDASLVNLTPESLSALVAPALAGDFDYVCAYYRRHPFEGALTKSILAPLFRSLYGVRLRQPATREFGCSPRLVDHFLQQGFWAGDDAHAGVDVWLATEAITTGFRVCEVDLGVRRHARRPEAPDVSTALTQLVGVLFLDIDARAHTWQRVRGSAVVPVVARLPVETVTAPPVSVEELIEAFRLGYSALRDVWAWIVPPKVILQLKRLAEAPPERFRFEDDLWARVLYDFALGFHLRSMARDHLLGSLTPLYLGWLASFIVEMRGSPPEAIEERFERLGRAFETEKPYFISRWRWPETFRA